MKKTLTLLTAVIGLHLPFTTQAVVMATLSSSSGTSTINSPQHEGAEFITTQVYFAGSMFDMLKPANAGAPVLDLKAGYCAIASNAELFLGSKIKVLTPGRHDVNASYAFKYGIHSLAIYWNGSTTCQPEFDYPLIYNSTKSNYFPLRRMSAIPAGVYTTGWDATMVNGIALVKGDDLADSYYVIDHTYYLNWGDRGFTSLARYLTVPTCSRATLEYDYKRMTYGAGEYDVRTDFPVKVRLAKNERSKDDCKVPGNVPRSATGGLVRHNVSNGRNLCLNPENGGVPTLDTRAVLTANCSTSSPYNKFRTLFDGTIQHVQSGMCLHPKGGASVPAAGTELVFWPVCKQESIKFEMTQSDSLRQLSSGYCLHPSGGSPTPAVGTPVVFWPGCNEDRLRFTFSAQ